MKYTRSTLAIVLCILRVLVAVALQQQSCDRRRFMGTSAVGFATFLPNYRNVCNAVPPITVKETEYGVSKIQRLLRPNPPKILRQPLFLDFAVTLMRSSYAVTDNLDVIAMNQFQRDFFLIRSAEYQTYSTSLGPGFVKQGDLTDPSYFDFISFAQYTTIRRALSDPPTLFEEQQPIISSANDDDNVPQRFETVVVQRTVPTAQLAEQHDSQVGAAILKYLDDTYTGTPSALPLASNEKPTPEAMQAMLTQLVKLFLVNGFAWEGTVELVPNPNRQGPAVTFCLTLVSPATIWSSQCLQSGASSKTIRNDFLLKTAKQLVQRHGYSVVSSSIKFDGNNEQSFISIV